MSKVFRIIFHLLTYPLLIVLILISNLSVIQDQFNNYGIYTLVGVILPFVLGIVFYVVYLIVCRNKSKLSKFAQTAIVSFVAVFTMGGLWAVCDRLLPDIISDATSSTIYYEDLAEDTWKERAEINAKLLSDFIELNIKSGVLPVPDEMDEEEALAYYNKLGVDKSIPEIAEIEKDEGYEYPFHTINELLAIQYESINANGYASFNDPWIGFATGSRLTVPCLLHLLLDKTEVDPDDIADLKSKTVKVSEDEDGNVVVEEVGFAVYDKEEGIVTLKALNWTVLDMLGENQEFNVGAIPQEGLVGTVLGMIDLDTVLQRVSVIIADEDILGAEVYISFDIDSGDLALIPADTEAGIEIANKTNGVYARGSIDYMKMAWLNSNGLLYAIVMLMSIRTYFLLFAGWAALMMFLDGCARGMIKEEKEKKKALIESQLNPLSPKDKHKKKKTVLVPAMTEKERKMHDVETALVRALRESKAKEGDDEDIFTLLP